MTRGLTAGMQTSIALESGVALVSFLELAFGGGTVRLATAPVDLAWDGQTWQGIGGQLTYTPPSEAPGDERAQGTELTLSGVDQTILAVLLQQAYIGRGIRIWHGHVAMPGGTIVADPLLLFTGFMNGGFDVAETVDFDQASCVITTRVVSRLAQLGNRRGIKSNVESHGRLFLGDLFFQHTPQLADREIIWGPFKTQWSRGKGFWVNNYTGQVTPRRP